MSYRVVYGETMPTWEKMFLTKREAESFAKKHRSLGDVIFNIRKVDLNERGPFSIMGAIAADEALSKAPAPPDEVCPKDGRPCYVGGENDKHHRCGTAQCAATASFKGVK